MANNFDLSALALAMACPGNALLLDDKGLPGAYVPRPAMQLNALLTNGDSGVHPAFLYNGVQKDKLYFGKYQACVNLNRAYSLPGVDPKANVSFTSALQYCLNKGDGHHLMTAAEWAFLALSAKKRGTQPRGNNSYGKDGAESAYLAIPASKNGDGRTLRTATGTGPLTWSDTGDAAGVFDLNGNVWEFVAGLRLRNGELQVIPYNNAADPTVDMSAASPAWKALKAAATSYNDLYVTPEGNGATSGSVKLDFVNSAWRWSAELTGQKNEARIALFQNTGASEELSDFVKTHLRAMALLPESGDSGYGSDIFWANNGNSASALYAQRGGDWSMSGHAGAFSLFFCHGPGQSSASFGFRPAFMET